MKNIVSISLFLVGAMVGVGLAGGREIVSFFMRNGVIGFLFCFVSSVVIFVLVYVCLLMNLKNSHKKENCKSDEFVTKNNIKVVFCGKKYKTDMFFEFVIFFCQLAICSAMFAGMFSIFSEISDVFIVRLLLIFCVYVFAIVLVCGKSKFVFSLNLVLTVVLLLFSFVLLLFLFAGSDFDILKNCDFSVFSIFGLVLYAGMNVLTIYPILKERAVCLKSKKECFFVSLFVSFLIFIVLELLSLCVYFFGGENIFQDMIMLSISKSCSNVFFVFHFWIVLFSIFTTLISTAYGAVSTANFSSFKMRTFLILTFCFLMSFVGFSNLIDFVYPFIGFVFIVFVFVLFVSRRKNTVR